MVISMRASEREKEIIKEFANFYGITASEFMRRAVMEKIEDEFDLRAYEEAKAEFEKDPRTYTLKEVMESYEEIHR